MFLKRLLETDRFGVLVMKDLRNLHKVPKSAVLPGSFASGVGGLSWRLSNRATPYIAAAGHSPSFAIGRTPVPPIPLHRTSVSPWRPRGRSASREALLREIRTTGEDFRRPRPPPEKHHEHHFAQHPVSKTQRADVRFLGGCLRQKKKGAHHEHQQGFRGRKTSRKTP